MTVWYLPWFGMVSVQQSRKKLYILLVFVSTTEVCNSISSIWEGLYICYLHCCVNGWVQVTDSQPLLQLWPEIQIYLRVFMCKYKTEESVKDCWQCTNGNLPAPQWSYQALYFHAPSLSDSFLALHSYILYISCLLVRLIDCMAGVFLQLYGCCS